MLKIVLFFTLSWTVAFYITWANIRLVYLSRKISMLNSKAIFEMNHEIKLDLSLKTINRCINRVNLLIEHHTYRRVVIASLMIWKPLDKFYSDDIFQKETWPDTIGESHDNSITDSPHSN